MKNSQETLRKRNEKRKWWRENTDKSIIPPFVIKQCKKCNTIEEHYFNSSFTSNGKPEYKSSCKNCQKIINKKQKEKFKEKNNARAKKNKHNTKLKAIQYLGGECIKCGYSKSKRALTFHHRNRDEKEHTISQIIDWSWDKIQSELDKCDLFCFNCHMEIEEEYDLLKEINS